MKQGKFTLRKLSQIWGENHQSLNTQLPELSEGAYTPTYPTQSEYRTGGAALNTAIDDSSETWTNVQAINSDTGENELSRTSSEQIPINVWGDLLLNGRKVIKEYAAADSPYFTSLQLMLNPGFDKDDLQAGEFCFTDDGNGDIFLNDGAEIVRFIRSDSHVRYENINDVVVREINWIDSVEPSTNLYEGALWYNTAEELIYRYDGNDFLKVYYPSVDDNNGAEYTEEGSGQPKYNVIYVYAPFDAYNNKVPTDIYYWNGSKLVSFSGGAGGNGRVYVRCSTASATAIKEITITSAATSYADLAGTEFAIEFINGTTSLDVYSTAQLDINGLGAINFKNYTSLSTNAKINTLPSNGVLDVIILEYPAASGTYVAAVQNAVEVTSPASETYHFMLFPRNFNTSSRTRLVNTYNANADNSLSYTNNIITGKNTYFNIKAVSTNEGYGSGGTTVGTNIQTEGTILADDKISTKQSVIIDATDSQVEISSSKYQDITTVEIGSREEVQKGIKRVSIYGTYDPDVDGISKVIYSVPNGYMMVSVNGTDFRMGIAYYNTGSSAVGPQLQLEYDSFGGTAVSLTTTPAGSGWNSIQAFSHADVPTGSTAITIRSADVGKGPVAYYGEYILVPDVAMI